MKRHINGSPGKAYSDGFAAGLAKGRDERAAEVAQIKTALDKALAENLAMRPKPESTDAMIARHESTAATTR